MHHELENKEINFDRKTLKRELVVDGSRLRVYGLD
jgi:hypothetical protein